MARVLFPVLALMLSVAPMQSYAQDVTIYRCVGTGGKLTLRDSPCAPGETQQMRSMQRPRDPAPAPTAVPVPAQAVAPSPPQPQRQVQVVYRTPPRPMYECVTADGDRYQSDNDEGNPRWVPVWTLGYGGWGGRGHGGVRPGRPPPDGPAPPGPPPGPRPPGPLPPGPLPPGVFVPAGNTYVRDECHALPQAEVCARLSDRRYEIIRRYNSAMQSERRQLELEQRGIDARLDNDCGNP